MSVQPIRKIIWAVDAFTEDTALQVRLSRQLKNWAHDSAVTIQPVTVLSPNQLNLPSNIFADLSNNIEIVAFKRMSKMTEKSKIPGLLKPEVLISRNDSLREAVQTILSYAKQVQADLIAVSTLSKKGVSHFLFGSFAEALILQSEIPTFVINPKTHNLKRRQSILFPCDLSDASRDAFEKVLKTAKERSLSIVLFNRIEYLNQYSIAAFDNTAYTKCMEDNIATRKKELETLAQYARAKGVKIDWRIDQKSGRSVSDAIVAVAKEMKVSMIAMASQSGPVSSAILGSTTRQVIRSAACPIWVVHPGQGAGAMIYAGTSERKLKGVATR